MIKNYFTVAFRNLWRSRVFSMINIAGLAIGISASLVIYMFVHYDYSFDKFHANKERIYRVVTNMHFPGKDFKNSGVPGPLPPAAKIEIPGIESSTQFWTEGHVKVTVPSAEQTNNSFRKQGSIIFADDQYFSFFKYKWLAGSPVAALSGPGKVVLTASRAKTYFPHTDPAQVMGKTIVYNDTVNTTVTGIVQDLDDITDFTFKEFISFPTFEARLKDFNGFGEWNNVSSSSQFFIRLKEGTDSAKMNRQLAQLRKKHVKDAYLPTDHYLQALSDIHFNADYDNFGQRLAHKPTLNGLMAVASFLLILGCINFINLTTAQASKRAKEIGIRKTMGSGRLTLVVQFLCETLLLTFGATVLSVILSPWILKLFGNYIPEGVRFDLFQPNIIIFLLLLVVVVSSLSGFYPALILSGFKPVTVLKNVAYANTGQSRRTWVRKTLIVSQFIIAQFFIIATLVVGKQIRYAVNIDMGFKKEAIINFEAPFNYTNPDNKQFVLQEKLKAIPGIQQLSLAGMPPASSNFNISTIKFNKDGKDIETSIEMRMADTNYLGLYKIKLLAGRNLQQSDTMRELLVNEAYARFLGYKNTTDVVGKNVMVGSGSRPIVGLIADTHSKSMHDAIAPMAITSQAKYHTTFHVDLGPKGENTDNWKATISRIEAAWKTIYPEEEFKYSFFDESIAKMYKKEQQTAGLLRWSAGLAIFISCLGLLGLVMYTTNQRVKEIGIRKVLGASVIQIVSLLSKDFVRLVMLAFLITIPLAWWAMREWLNDFAYRTNLSWWIFAACGGSMLVIALLIMSVRTVGAALDNPVNSLRNE